MYSNNAKSEQSTIYRKGSRPTGQTWEVYVGDALTSLKKIESGTVDCIITSPPYFWLRDYKVEGQLGLEDGVSEYLKKIIEVTTELFRVLKPTGVFFLNIGDTYYSGKGESKGKDKKSSKRRFGLRAVDKSGGMDIGIKPKSLIGIPWRVVIEMLKFKWVLRSSIIWYRKNALPESVKDRPKRSYENLFMFSKSKSYYFDRSELDNQEQEDMWTISARPEHSKLGTAPFPDELVKRCISIGCPENGVILDPFSGSGTTLRVGLDMGRSVIGIELNESFANHILRMIGD